MPRVYAVIGANFGDEGKGLMTDYLAEKLMADSSRTVVVRYNGGSQAGHTVVRNGYRHVFGHVGSGTFAGAPTYLDEKFIVNPLTFYKEMKDLISKGFDPIVSINPSCRVTTQYDVILNHLREAQRGDGKHGSCGVGIFETIKRSNFVPLTAFTLFNSYILKDIFSDIRDYFYAQVKEDNIEIPAGYQEILNADLFDSFMNLATYMKNQSNLFTPDFLKYQDHIIYEGAQGLLLSKDNIEYAPHLTPSYTGTTNVVQSVISSGMSVDRMDVLYVTRPYMTRHGAGKFVSEDSISGYTHVVDATNIPNEFQGSLRFGYLDADLMLERIDHDRKPLVGQKFAAYPCLVMTCMDQLLNPNALVFKANGTKVYGHISSVHDFFREKLRGYTFRYESYGPTANDVRRTDMEVR